MKDIIEKLWYAKIEIPNHIKIKILERGISLNKLYNYSNEEYMAMGFSLKYIDKINSVKDIDYYKKTLEYMNREKIRFIFIDDDEYPRGLKNIEDPPIGLFVKGEFKDTTNALAIVGARRATSYGKTVAYNISRELSNLGIVIISGLAMGIDASAHRGAIESNNPTIGVIGSGHKHMYPKTNDYLYESILKDGCIVSEYFPEVPPMKHRFPERNRIISGLSKGALIVEAGERSGSLITASLALEQGRDVYAIPGDIFSSRSIGCNNLIKEGAKIVTSYKDILEDFNFENKNSKVIYENLSIEEQNLIEFLKTGPKSFEDIAYNINIPVSNLLQLLGKLECISIVKRLYGSYYSIYQT